MRSKLVFADSKNVDATGVHREASLLSSMISKVDFMHIHSSLRSLSVGVLFAISILMAPSISGAQTTEHPIKKIFKELSAQKDRVDKQRLPSDPPPTKEALKSVKDLEAQREKASAEPIETQAPQVAFQAAVPRALPIFEGSEVLVIPIHGTIDLGLPPFIDRVLKEHPQASAVILDVDTFGGRVDAAVQIRDRLLSEGKPTIAFVNRRAISAGALISFAANYIVFAEGGTMGAATPIQVQSGKAKAVGEKMVSYFRSEMRSTAEANDWDGDLAEAMVDAEKEVPGACVKGKLLTVTTNQAEEFGLMNARHNTLDELIEAIGLKNARRIEAETNWAEQVSRAVTDPTLSGLLMSVGMLGIMIELYSPGIGFAGALGLFSLLTFFLGHKVAGLAGMEELLLLLLGFILLAVELFIIPGFGVAGVLGILFIAVGMVTSMGELPEGVSWNTDAFAGPIELFIYSLLATIVGVMIIAKYLPKSSFGSWLMLNDTLSGDPSSGHLLKKPMPESDELGLMHLMGVEGVTTTPLKLSGKAKLGSMVVDVVSRDEYLETGIAVKVVEIEGIRVVVTRV